MNKSMVQMLKVKLQGMTIASIIKTTDLHKEVYSKRYAINNLYRFNKCQKHATDYLTYNSRSIMSNITKK